VRTIDDAAIKAHAERRFRSEYDYALFEYWRSAKVFALLDRAGVSVRGRVLDAGCGGGGMPLSLAEETSSVVAIDIVNRFVGAGTRLARERSLPNLHFAQADGQALPFSDASFDVVLSHAVIEHVADAPRYLRECRRVLKPGGWMYLSTAPYLSFAGAHLPRLKIPVPLHLIFGRTIAFKTFVQLAKHAPWTLREPEYENTFIKLARQNRLKDDDLLELVRVKRLRGQVADAGFGVLYEHLHVTKTFRNLPGPIARWVRDSPLVQDVATSSIEFVMERA
jgi:2-polyprenyl-3-methyl-5-hydroxy-6-metoxy-1,4-benzoquinol methylase